VKSAASALAACLGCVGCHRACPDGGDERAACLAPADVDRFFDLQSKLLGLFEAEIQHELADQPVRCGSFEQHVGPTAFATLQSRLPVLLRAADLSGVTVAIACGDYAIPVASSGAPADGFAGLSKQVGTHTLAWGSFTALPRGLEVTSELPLAHEKAKIVVLYRLP
jgi:hypothetical protein